MTRYGLRTMLCRLRNARRDLSAPPHYEDPPLPYAFVLGPAEVQEAGRDTASRTPLGERPVRLGPGARPGFYYALGDAGTAEGWTALERLLRHLRGAPPA